ncbi:uncharacterized protein METZ01_LOCUS403189, partial [marine metagenome]
MKNTPNYAKYWIHLKRPIWKTMKNILIITIPILLFTSILYGQTKKTGVLYL